jgi:hypothetical protein
MNATSWAVLLAVLLAGAVVLGVFVLLLERPIRVTGYSQTRRWSVIGLVATIAAIIGVVVAQEELGGFPPPAVRAGPSPGKGSPLDTVLRAVRASTSIRVLPPNLVPSLAEADAPSNLGTPPVSTGCWPSAPQANVPSCVFGDPSGRHTMVLYGDSHAGMWFDALDDIAARAHWKLVVLTKGACPAAPLHSHAPGEFGPWTACTQWHQFAVARIRQIDPSLLIVSQSPFDETPKGGHYTPAQWKSGLRKLLALVATKKTSQVVLGDIPASGGPDCLAKYTHDVQRCSLAPLAFLTPYNKAERRAAAVQGARYIDVMPWFCIKSCSSVIGRYSVYYATNHVAVGYSRFLESVLADQLHLGSFARAR